MGILGDTQPRPPGPPNTSSFPSDSVLGRMARGAFKPTDADLEELRTLAQSGNRAERRAAAKQLKKLGIAAPEAPASPVVMPAAVVADKGATAAPLASVKTTAHQAAPKKAASKKTAPKKTAPENAAPRKAAPETAAPKKAAPKKAASKNAAIKKPAPGKSATDKKVAKKTVSKKTTPKKAGRD